MMDDPLLTCFVILAVAVVVAVLGMSFLMVKENAELERKQRERYSSICDSPKRAAYKEAVYAREGEKILLRREGCCQVTCNVGDPVVCKEGFDLPFTLPDLFPFG